VPGSLVVQNGTGTESHEVRRKRKRQRGGLLAGPWPNSGSVSAHRGSTSSGFGDVEEPLYRVHECVFGILAMEREPVDPRL